MKKTIGIIGGAGPMAGVLLNQLIIEICQKNYKCKKDKDFPLVMLLSFPFSDMLSTKKKLKIVSKELNQALNILEKNKMDIAAIACNTLHIFLKKTKRKYKFINMLQEIKEKVSKEKVLVFCTRTSVEAKIYNNICNAIYPKKENQKIINKIINDLNKGKMNKKTSEKLIAIALKEIRYNNFKIKKIILGCTEISLLNKNFGIKIKKLKIIDPLYILAEKLCQETMS
jgi:aspartate racemase